ncbi:MAG: hypothetical protein ABH842_03910 [Candidatus Micrarchaeota archaeon]
MGGLVMGGPRLTRSEDKHLYSHSERCRPGHGSNVFRRYFGIGLTSLLLFGGINMATTVRPAAAQEHKEDQRITQAKEQLAGAISAIGSSFSQSRDFGIPNPSVNASSRLVSGEEGLVTLLAQHNGRLRQMTGGVDVFPVTGSTSEEQFVSLNAWLGKEHKACPDCTVSPAMEGRTATSPIDQATLDVINTRIQSALTTPGAFSAAAAVAAVTTVHRPAGEETRTERLPADIVPKPIISDALYTGVVSELDLIIENPESTPVGHEALRHREKLATLKAGGEAKQDDLRVAYRAAKVFSVAHIDASTRLRDDALAAEREAARLEAERARVPPAEREAQAYHHSMVTKALEIASQSTAILGSYKPTEPGVRAAYDKMTERLNALSQQCTSLQGKPKVTFEEANEVYTQTLLAADAVATMDILMKYASVNGLAGLSGRPATEFWKSYTGLVSLIGKEGTTESQYDDAVAGLYSEVSGKLTTTISSDIRSSVEAIARLRIRKAGFYFERARVTMTAGETLSLESTQLMLDQAMRAVEDSGATVPNEMLELSKQWRASSTDPVLLYSLAHSLISIREAELWTSDKTASMRPSTTDPATLQAARTRVELAKQAFMWNFSKPQLDPTYYLNMSTALADDAIHMVVPALRFTEGSAGVKSGFEYNNTGPGMPNQFDSAMLVERSHLVVLAAVRDLDLRSAIQLHSAKQDTRGDYALPGLFSRLTTAERLATGLPTFDQSKGRVYLLGADPDLNMSGAVLHDAPGFDRYGLGYSVARREAVLTANASSPYLLRSSGFLSELNITTGQFVSGQITGQQLLTTVADKRIAELEARLGTVLERNITIAELPNRNPGEERVYYVTRAKEALEQARTLRGQTDLVSLQRSIEVAELGLEGLSTAHLTGLVPEQSLEFPCEVTALDTRRLGPAIYMIAHADVSVNVDGSVQSLAEYERVEGKQRLLYSWQFYTNPGFDSNYYLVNPKYGAEREPEFIGRVVRGMEFSDGTTGDAVVAIRQIENRWVDVTAADGTTLVMYRLQKTPEPSPGTIAAESFRAVDEGEGSIMDVLDAVSVKTAIPDGVVRFKGFESSKTNAGLVITKIK